MFVCLYCVDWHVQLLGGVSCLSSARFINHRTTNDNKQQAAAQGALPSPGGAPVDPAFAMMDRFFGGVEAFFGWVRLLGVDGWWWLT